MKLFRSSVLSVLVASVALAQATVVTKEATGEAAIVGKNEEKAFNDAREQALRSAVEQAAGVRVDADTLTLNNQLVRDQIFTNTSGYVKKFDVVSKKVEKGVVSVTVKADVITENLDKDIQAARDLVKRFGRPKLAIIIQEQTVPIGEKVVLNSDHLSKFLGEAMAKDGWEIIDPAAMNGKVHIAAGATMGENEAKDVGNITKANYILYGQATFRHQDDPMRREGDKQSYYPVSGEYSLAIFATDSGTQIGRFNGTIVTKLQDKDVVMSYERSTYTVLKVHQDELSAPVRKNILEYFRNRSQNGSEISLSVSGLDNVSAVKQFKEAISTIKGVKAAEFQNDFAKGKASFRVTYLGQTSELAEAVEAATFKKKKLDVVAMTSSTMEIAVGK